MGHARDGVSAQHLCQLVAGDGLVFARANPGANHVAHAGLLELGHQATQTALAPLIAQHARDGLQQLRVVGHHADDAAQTALCGCRRLGLLTAHHGAQNRIK